MKYAIDLTEKLYVMAPAVSGAIVGQEQRFVAWQPSTWPTAPMAVDENFIYVLKRIFEDSMLTELSNAIGDIHKSNGSLAGRGHVIAIAEMCALDAIASYGYRSHHVSDFIRSTFEQTTIHLRMIFTSCIATALYTGGTFSKRQFIPMTPISKFRNDH
jgi:hypothetical protein